uniref:Phosphoglyceromutase n=1 Tax=Ascaris lumbricoides TaxID=6252 RepID=A0A0M3I5M0_ASCLU
MRNPTKLALPIHAQKSNSLHILLSSIRCRLVLEWCSKDPYSLPFSRPLPVNAKRYWSAPELASPVLVPDRGSGLIPRNFVLLLAGDGVGMTESPAGQTLVANGPSNFRDWLKIGWHY